MIRYQMSFCHRSHLKTILRREVTQQLRVTFSLFKVARRTFKAIPTTKKPGSTQVVRDTWCLSAMHRTKKALSWYRKHLYQLFDVMRVSPWSVRGTVPQKCSVTKAYPKFSRQWNYSTKTSWLSRRSLLSLSWLSGSANLSRRELSRAKTK